ncbi:MAG: transposase [Armatimonadota bacterium]|nr:transposase [Armatimonadota bacterium]
MKWKNLDAGAAYYYITATITEWMPLLERPSIREMVCRDIAEALKKCGGSLTAYVIMPNHLHLLVYLPEGVLHKFCKLWRGRSGRHIPQLLDRQEDVESLRVIAAHANGGCRYAAWKEQVRAIAIWSKHQVGVKIDYIHENPLRRGLVTQSADWPHSSCRFYEMGDAVEMEITPMEP